MLLYAIICNILYLIPQKKPRTITCNERDSVTINLLYAVNINGDHFKICIMVIRLTFVFYQMTSSVHV